MSFIAHDCVENLDSEAIQILKDAYQEHGLIEKSTVHEIFWTATALHQYCYEEISEGVVTPKFPDNASEVWERGSGDCTDQVYLLGSLLNSNKIPWRKLSVKNELLDNQHATFEVGLPFKGFNIDEQEAVQILEEVIAFFGIEPGNIDYQVVGEYVFFPACPILSRYPGDIRGLLREGLCDTDDIPPEYSSWSYNRTSSRENDIVYAGGDSIEPEEFYR